MAGAKNNIHCEQGGEPDTTSRSQDDILSTGKQGRNYYVRNIELTYIAKEFKMPNTDPGSLNDVCLNQDRKGLITKAGTQNNIYCTMFQDAGY